MTQQRLGDLSAIKLALMAKKLRADAAAVLRAEPIAIVGMGARCPGAESPEELWSLLSSGRDAIREVPSERWNLDALFDPDPAAPGKMLTRSGGFLDQVEGFDAAYFGILSREAERMDPQQRLFLEVSIEALEDAGLSRERLRGSRTSVFVASYHDDYSLLQLGDLEGIDERTLTGTLQSVVANRLSYFLDLRGPSVTIDSACSSSLVAVHLACQSLRAGESDLAVAGGVSLIVNPTMMVAMSKVGFMAPDGRCKTFDAAANGFGRGEGAGAVVLKRLSDAIADDDRIVGVIRASAVNQDGHSTVLAAPNGMAQRELIREALSSAQLDSSRIGFVEAHGTGTALGDPIEVEALAETVGKPAPDASACYIGSAKANLGHLEAAAGVVGLIKTVLALEHGAVPPQPKFEKLNPYISLAGSRLQIPRELTPWPRGAAPRCAAVSSFGVGGTNAHVIVEEKPVLPARAAKSAGAGLLALSAPSPEALGALATSCLAWLRETPASLDDICFTAARRRSHFEHRLAVAGASKEALAERLAERLEGSLAKASGPSAVSEPRVAFVFSGQGPQWYAMGRELLGAEPVFRQVIEECDALLTPHSGWSLLAELGKSEGESRLGETEIAQPALFALQIALAALLESWGVRPDGVVGHSAGEIAALHVAGVLSRAEALRIIWHRGRIMQGATGHGRMAQVSSTAEQARESVSPYGERLSVAALNGPRSSVISGEARALEELLASLAARGVGHRMLPVNYAFHSAQMAPFRDELVATLGSISTAPARVPVYSTVTGALASSPPDAHYFGSNVRETVRFESAIASLAADGFQVFVEISPHPVLSAAISECLDARSQSGTVLASLRRTRPEREALLEVPARLYELGGSPRWQALAPQGSVVPFPRYPWQRKRHWLARASSGGRGQNTGHPLLGRRVPAAVGAARIYEGGPELAEAWLGHHRIFEQVIVPGAAVLDLFHAAVALGSGPAREVTGFAMHRPLYANDPAATRWQTVVKTGAEPTIELHQSKPDAGEDDEWQLVASGSFAERGPRLELSTPNATEPLDPAAVYERFAELGVGFGPTFRCLREIRRGEGTAEARIDMPQGLEAGYGLHPVLLDAAIQLCCLAAPRGARGELPSDVFLPLGADRFRVLSPLVGSLRARVQVRDTARSLTADLILEASTPSGVTRVAEVEGLRFARADASAFAAEAPDAGLSYTVEWAVEAGEPAASAEVQAAGAWAVCLDQGGFGQELVTALGAAGEAVVTLNAGEPEELAASLSSARGQSLRGVIDLTPLDAPALSSGSRGAAADALAPSLHLARALASAGVSCPLWVVSRGATVVSGGEVPERLQPEASGAWGLASVVALEHPELEPRRVDLDPDAETRAVLPALLARLRMRDGSRTAALREGRWWVPRLEAWKPATRREASPIGLALARPGSLDGVELRPVPRAALAPGEVRLKILASGINFRDVLLALDMYPGGGVPLGVECAGVVIELGPGVTELALGERVFGYAPGGIGTEVCVPAVYLGRIPARLGAEQAAALPVAYLTAYYGLHRLASLQRGQRVLIHAAAGGVGLAAVELARRAGAEIFGTAGSDQKRELLRARGVHHTLDSRSLSFADRVRELTGGAGVDVVLNSLAGEFIPASLALVAAGGTFLEIGKRGVMSEEEARRARPDVRYHLYDLGARCEADPPLLQGMLGELIGALERGEIEPLPIQVFPLDQVSEAFRFMAQARHVGKLVVRPSPTGLAGPLVSESATYLVTGGLGGVGLETARWLAGAGARSLVLTGRRAPNERARAQLAELSASGVNVRVEQVDVADRAAMAALLASIAEGGRPLRGVVHSAGVVDDAPIVRQDATRAEAVLGPKARGAFLLHELTRDQSLDFFVLYSAAGPLLGAPGQSTYAAANAELDALALSRRRLGLPALSVSWGSWAGAGMAAELAARGSDVWAKRGLGKLTPEQAFPALERLLREGVAHAAIVSIDWSRFLASLAPGADRSFFAVRAEQKSTTKAGKDEAPPLLTSLQAIPPTERRAALLTHLADRALHVVGLDRSTPLHPGVPLKDVGLDSLMAVELRNVLARSTAAALPATLLFDYPTLDALADHLWRLLSLDSDARASDLALQDAEKLAAEREIASLSDEEAEALLLQELEASERRTHGA